MKSFKIKLLVSLLLIIVALSMGSVFADSNLILLNDDTDNLKIGASVDILEDPLGQFSIEEVTSGEASEKFIKHEKDIINLGIRKSVFWLRFTLQKSDQNPLMLDLGTQYVSYADLYTPDFEQFRDKKWNIQSRGGLKKLEKNEIVYRNVTFDLPSHMAEPTTFYLRVASKSPLFMPLRIIKETEFRHLLDIRLLLFGMFYGLMIGLFLYNVFIYTFVKERTYLYYLMYVLSLIVYFMAMNRLTTEFFFRQNPAVSPYISLLSLGVASCFMILYAQSFLKTKTLMPLMHIFLSLLIMASVALSVGIFIFDYRIMNQYSTIIGLLVPISLLVAAILAARRRHKNARYYIIASLVVLVGTLVYTLTFIGVLPYNFFTFYSFQISTAIEAIMLSIALADKINKLNRDLNEALQLVHLGYYDSLTGLNNRRFFDDEIKRIDISHHLPLTAVVADVNGLKLANDVFGHEMGDQLLTGVAKIIRTIFREDDIVVRNGGDEFAIILKRTDALQVEKIIQRIQAAMSAEKIGAMNMSVSFGHATITKPGKTILEVLKEADQRMYECKFAQSSGVRNKMIETIKDAFYNHNAGEKQHAILVSELCLEIGKALELGHEELNILQTAGYLHDIGKITVKEETLRKDLPLNSDEWQEIRRHPENGYRILKSSKDYSGCAEAILSHHERYDGAGYPSGIMGEAIPVAARIIAIAEAYVYMTTEGNPGNKLSTSEAISEIREQTSRQFDPMLVEVLLKILSDRNN